MKNSRIDVLIIDCPANLTDCPIAHLTSSQLGTGKATLRCGVGKVKAELAVTPTTEYESGYKASCGSRCEVR